MYIYQLPFEINKELCRLLDSDEDWKELAGVHMRYSAFDVNEIEQEAKRLSTSPCNQLFVRWGQLNHRVEELFILLHRMKHVPAMRCLVPVVDSRFHRLLKRDSYICGKDTADIDENANKERQKGSDSSLPLPVMLIEKGVEMATSSNIVKRHQQSGDTSTDDTNSSSVNGIKSVNDELIRKVSVIPMLSYEDLRIATDNWSEANLLGRGGFGHVYKGEWKLLPVAVKRLRDNDEGINTELIREMCLNQYRHDNILPLYGYSLGGPEACLVYQLMGGGSLEQRLRLKTHHPPLTWKERHQIALGVARGLQYLHTMAGTPLIHGDIKPANILLDQCSMPKIGDFGLARRGPYGDGKSHLKVSRVHGTRPYLPEEYLRSRCLSAAVDVFSFGVLTIEMATALHSLDKTRQQHLLSDYVHALADEGIDLAVLEDRTLIASGSRPALCRSVISLGLLCTSLQRHQRPPIIDAYNTIAAMDVS